MSLTIGKADTEFVCGPCDELRSKCGHPYGVTLVTVRDGFSGREASLADALEAAEHFLTRFVVLPNEHAYVAVTLWAAHAHAIEAWESTPRLALMSPEKRCGKSRVQEVVSTLVPNPMRTADVTTAVLFRSIAEDPRPTVFLDEVDTVWTGKTGENESLRALVNAGHRIGNDTRRMVGEGSNMTVGTFRTFAALCLAGIGDLPDTIADRSVIITMQRKTDAEQVERWRIRANEPEGHSVGELLSAAVAPLIGSLRGAFPEIPAEINDRAADVWEPLLAIADAAGGDWPNAARAACLALSEGMEEQASTGVRLLADLRTIWPHGQELVATNDLLFRLHRLEDAPWGDSDGRSPLSARRLALLLKGYRIKPVHRRDWRGYERSSLAEPWARYLPPLSENPSQTVTPVTEKEM